MPPNATRTVLLAALLPAVLGCTTIIAGKAATTDGSVLCSHSNDGEGNTDPRLVHIPSQVPPRPLEQNITAAPTSITGRAPHQFQNVRAVDSSTIWGSGFHQHCIPAELPGLHRGHGGGGVDGCTGWKPRRWRAQKRRLRCTLEPLRSTIGRLAHLPTINQIVARRPPTVALLPLHGSPVCV